MLGRQNPHTDEITVVDQHCIPASQPISEDPRRGMRAATEKESNHDRLVR
jgi:hypothetical protein